MRRFVSCVLVLLVLLSIGCSSSFDSVRGYRGNKKSRIFHRYSCEWAQRISSKNAVDISSREEAIKKYHMRPCKSCKP